MTPVVGFVAIGAALAVLAIVANQISARLGLVEVTLNEGLPPGHEPSGPTRGDGDPTGLDPAKVLSPGTHIFLSRTCHACQRLLDELADRPTGLARIVLHYVDRPRPLAAHVAEAEHAELRIDERELAGSVGADPLPHTIAIGPHGLVARGVTPTRIQVIDTARQAGLSGVQA